MNCLDGVLLGVDDGALHVEDIVEDYSGTDDEAVFGLVEHLQVYSQVKSGV